MRARASPLLRCLHAQRPAVRRRIAFHHTHRSHACSGASSRPISHSPQLTYLYRAPQYLTCHMAAQEDHNLGNSRRGRAVHALETCLLRGGPSGAVVGRNSMTRLERSRLTPIFISLRATPGVTWLNATWRHNGARCARAVRGNSETPLRNAGMCDNARAPLARCRRRYAQRRAEGSAVL